MFYCNVSRFVRKVTTGQAIQQTVKPSLPLKDNRAVKPTCTPLTHTTQVAAEIQPSTRRFPGSDDSPSLLAPLPTRPICRQKSLIAPRHCFQVQ